jgi:hypothetical protein
MLQSETAPVKGPLGLIPIAVTALFDDYGPVAAVSVPAAIPAAMQAAVVVTELGACAAKVITIAEPDPIAVAADADADAEIFSAGYGRRRNGNRRQGCKRKTKFSHVPSFSRNCPREKRWNRTLVPGEKQFHNPACCTSSTSRHNIHPAVQDNIAAKLFETNRVLAFLAPVPTIFESNVSR